MKRLKTMLNLGDALTKSGPYLFLGEFNRHAAFVSISASGQQYSRLNGELHNYPQN